MDQEIEIKKYRERLSDFVEAAAHDLHAPLRKISVLTDRVFTKHGNHFDSDAREYISRINSCIGEMQSLIDGLTELAKTDTDWQAFESCDLNLVVKETLPAMTDETVSKRVQFSIGELPLVRGNLTQYRQLFKNLLENAVKFSRKNAEIKIAVSSGLLDPKERSRIFGAGNQTYYKIDIVDNGIGFNPEFTGKIFEPFVRLNSKADYQGNGLGLSICKKIVANHHGIIYAEGNENVGARFILILPETP